MDTKTLSDFVAWSKNTDLQEIIYKKNGTSVQIKTAQANAQISDFTCKLTPVKAPAVGLYQCGKKGKAINIMEDMPVKKGDALGHIEMNNAVKEVTAPCDGTLKIILISDGQPAQYGTPLFFIEPK
jgi:acetyl-CoA carboxylase biotin carboxyl carrier protein